MSAPGEREQLARENERLRERIDELERAAAQNADAARFLQSLLLAVPAFIVRADPDLRLRYLNHYQPGLTPDQVLGRSLFDFLEPTHREQARAIIEHTLQTGKPGSFETLGQGAHGATAVYDAHIAALPEDDGRNGLCLVALEVTRHKQREQALSESEEKLRLALDATGLGLWSWDVESNEMVWDDAMRRLHGRDSPPDLQHYFDAIVHPLDRDTFVERTQRMLSSGQWDAAPYRIVRPDGDVRWLLANGRVVTADDGTVVRLMGGTLDVTAARELEEQLRQVQKMDALGNLTAGIAHNFNNMLTVIMPTLDLAVPLVAPDRQPLLREAAHAARRASELVRQLMTFAGQARSNERAVHALAPIIDAAVGICRRAFGRRIALDLDYAGPPAAVACNPGQLEQVLVNLLLNARDAVLEAGPDRGHVAVRVRTHGCELPARERDAARRPAVSIEVRDDGVGMSEQVRVHAFEPFFTTKPVGRGTGLGLTTSYAIVRDHQGTLTCESAPGDGTTLTIVLPLANEPLAATRVDSLAPLAPGLCALLVDDEASVRAAVGQVLAEFGLRVLSAASGAEALVVLQRQPEVDVILLDRSMPDAPGERFIPRMRQLAPRARILFFTGQTLEPELIALADGVVHKPVHGRELLEAIRRNLAGAGNRGGG